MCSDEEDTLVEHKTPVDSPTKRFLQDASDVSSDNPITVQIPKSWILWIRIAAFFWILDIASNIGWRIWRFLGHGP